jgi:Methyltransferase small domain
VASRLVDRARALIEASPGDSRAYHLVIASLRTDPSLVNAYAALADLLDARGADPYPVLRRVWHEHGSGDMEALRFVDQYARGDPANRLLEWCERGPRRPALIVRVAGDLEFLDLYDYDGVRGRKPAFVGRVHQPRLVCSPRDFGALPTTKQAIAEDLVKRGKDFRIVAHHDTTVELADRAVFGPAIDSVHFNAVLHRTLYRSRVVEQAARIVEIGVGSGFLFCSLIQALRQRPLEVVGSDVQASALATTRRNVNQTLARIPSAEQVHVRLEQCANLLERLPAGGIDLLLSNPPYIPERRPSGGTAYSGTAVVESLIARHAPRVLARGGVAVLLYSSLAAAAVQRSLEQSPLTPVVLGPSRRVPLDLREVSSDPAWIEMLLQHHGLEQTLDDPAHAYWHTLHVIALCRPEDEDLVVELGATLH